MVVLAVDHRLLLGAERAVKATTEAREQLLRAATAAVVDQVLLADQPLQETVLMAGQDRQTHTQGPLSLVRVVAVEAVGVRVQPVLVVLEAAATPAPELPLARLEL